LSTIEAFVTNLPPVIRDQVLTAAAYKVYVDKNMEWQSPTYDQMMAAIEKEAQSQKSP
jgi:hypothetical protein